MGLEYQHLNFYKVVKNKAKYNQGFGPKSVVTQNNKNNRENHYQKLFTNISHLENYYNAYFANKKRKTNSENTFIEIPLLLQIDVDADIFNDLYKYGLEFICEDEDGYILVATNTEGLKAFKDKLNKFRSYDSKENKGSGKVAEIHEICNEKLPEKRLSSYLFQQYPFNEQQEYTVDISIDCKGLEPFHISNIRKNESLLEYKARVKQEKLNKYKEWDDFLDVRADSFLEFLSDYDNGEYEILTQTTCDYTELEQIPESVDFRIKLLGKILNDITQNYPYVFEISEPDDIDCTQVSFDIIDDNNLLTIIEPNKNDPIVCVIDSGIQEGHKYIKNAIKEEFSVNYTDDETYYDEVGGGGHGTRVAGRIIFPSDIPQDGEYQTPCWVINSKVLNKNCKIPENKMPASLYEKIIDSNHLIAKIYNSSINSSTPVLRKHMSSWAAKLDSETYSKDILVIQSAGNINISYEVGFPCLGIQQQFDNNNDYPQYLYNSISSRIANPAQSFFALTVGSVSGEPFKNEILGIQSIEENKNSISSFSRSGFGLWNSIKPEVVDFGGGLTIDKNRNIKLGKETSVELLRRSPEGPAYAKDQVGTSYSTPVVSNIATLLQKEFPKYSALLYKTLIVHSAEWPSWLTLENITNEQKINLFRSYGYGIPNKVNALQNNPHKITFITTGSTTITSKDAHIHYIPIPDSIRNPEIEKNIKITVTLCYASKPRRTRLYKRGYLSTWLDWISIKKDESPEEFEDRIFEKETNDNKNFKWEIDNNSEWGNIKGIQRNNGATQKDWTILKSYELGEYFAIAVRSHKGWDNDPYSEAKYSLAVTIEAIDNDLPIYSEITNAVRNEIESETQIENKIF